MNITRNEAIIQKWEKKYKEIDLKKLRGLDEQEAERVKHVGCPFCGGILHYANYWRTFFGERGWCRYSFCCADCRKRVTPESVVFMYYKRYPAFVIYLCCFYRLQGEELKTLIIKFQASGVTIKRWLSWWEYKIPETNFWKEHRAYFSLPLEDKHPIKFLSDSFKVSKENIKESLLKILEFISPLSISSEKNEKRFGLGKIRRICPLINSA